MMFSSKPVVSLVISSEGPGESLDRTLKSLEAQSFPSFEVLVGGPAAKEVCRGPAVWRFTAIPIEGPGAGAELWSAGVAQASGMYVCCLLAGDLLSPTFLEKCLFVMEVEGWAAAAAFEDPRDPVPHIQLLSKQKLRGMDAFAKSISAGEPRTLMLRRIARSGMAPGLIPELLAWPGDLPAGYARESELPLTPDTGRVSYSYAGLVSGAVDQRPTVLLAMPFLTVGGSEAVVSRLCRELNGFGVRVLLYTTVPLSQGKPDTTAWFEDSTNGVYHLSRFLDIEHWPAFIAYLIQQHGVTTLWMAGSAYTYDLLPTLRELFPQLAVVDLLFNPVGHTANYLKYNYLIDHVVTEHNLMRDWLLERGEDGDRISVIPNGVDLVAYAPRPRLAWRTGEPRSERDGQFVVAFLGRLSEEKAPDVFLDIAALLSGHPAFEFLLCGTGPMEKMLRREAETRGLAARVHFLGIVPSREYLARCDAVVVCSRIDGRPNIVMESMAMGIPVVGSRVGAIPEMMPAGEADLLCEPDRADQFAAALRLLAEDPVRYRRSADAARRHAEKHFSTVGSSQAYARLFESLRRKRQGLDRRLAPAVVAAGLGYGRNPEAAGPTRLARRLWRAYSPGSCISHVRNALLLLSLRRSGREPDLLDRFDARYYTRRFPETKRWLLPPLLHYIFFGFREGRDPSPCFDTRYYIAANKDVRRAGMNPLLHYIMWGQSEGRAAGLKPEVGGPTTGNRRH